MFIRYSSQKVNYIYIILSGLAFLRRLRVLGKIYAVFTLGRQLLDTVWMGTCGGETFTVRIRAGKITRVTHNINKAPMKTITPCDNNPQSYNSIVRAGCGKNFFFGCNSW